MEDITHTKVGLRGLLWLGLEELAHLGDERLYGGARGRVLGLPLAGPVAHAVLHAADVHRGLVRGRRVLCAKRTHVIQVPTPLLSSILCYQGLCDHV